MNASGSTAGHDIMPGAWRAVWILFFVWTTAMVDRTIVPLLIPGIKETTGFSDTQVSLLHGIAFSASFAVAGIALGYFADRWNRRNLIFIGLLGWSLATIACGLSQSFGQFFAARMVVGASMGALAPAAISMIADMFPTTHRGKPMAVLLSGSLFGGALGSFLGGGLQDYFALNPMPELPVVGLLAPWQMALIGAGLPGLLALPLLATLREPEREEHAPAADGSEKFSILAHFRAYPVFFLLLLCTLLAVSMVGQGTGAWYPTLFMRNGSLTPSQTGLVLGGLALASGITAAVLGGILSDWAVRRDPYAGRLKLLVLCMVSQFATLLTLLAPQFVPGVIGGLAVFVVFAGISGTAIYSFLPDLVPPQGRALLVGINQFLGNLAGMGLAPTVVALVTDNVLRDESRLAEAMMIFGLPLLALGVIAALVAMPPLRRMRAAMG